ncbi:ABC transporter ATP-binding protein [Listeria monocytogenes]|mgnify:FL=1|jgi:ABC-type multidrug transport system, ATPase component|uniref:Lmo0986 protein n=2 Tax=Listeria monocytogenes TaxID=1639 RepID=Q8Y8C2_LISMO|nr:ABC transporter ATP-binding protein [Listeria monocytogenes]NP_464511.1 antibiotic ABC transporter ATP-binding protein [Listeria monocytogenes EGD-e]EAD5036881.1 ABC transporter ATP-binding protein [Listeria monocytogenes serotype 1/2a]EAE3703270.1 ABC transporter ATP-binding protein [Listeria monocytogenes serotype 1/2c]AEO25285.1 ABC transporter [Listeria monocytogenes FSL R2-561]ANE38846.1 ABC transporter [Listeria monocytogenes]ASH46602.1 putative antibiotic transport system ATP-bindin
MIKLTNVVKKFGKIEAVKGINLEVEKGSLFAFLGENGAGKSTTLSMICTESEPTSGEIYIDDEKLTFKNRKLFRQKLGVVFQENVLDDLLTVRENLYNRASLYGKTKAEITERLALVSSIMGIEDILNRRFEKLSGGQKRRAEIARAIMHDPEILLLDEPTTGLDPKTRVSVWKIIDYLREELGMTVFLTTHYLEEAKDADQLAVIHKGKIIAQGTPTNIRSRFSVDKIFFYDAKVAELQKIMKKANLPFKVSKATMRVDVITQDVEILAILNQAAGLYGSFEVIKGNLDDAFISMIKEESDD